jgi:hypothetical protein
VDAGGGYFVSLQKLPASVQEIADVIGRERALYLISKLPRYCASDNSERVMLYVPRNLPLDHLLVKILGWHDASKLAAAFPGEILKPANCAYLHKQFRDDHIARLVNEGISISLITEWLDLCERQVRNIVVKHAQEKPQVATQAANGKN